MWRKHCSDQQSLEEYAEAMHTLAARHWTKNRPSGRVEWCYETAVEFFRQGGLEKSMEKQRKRNDFHEAGKCCCCFTLEQNSTRYARVMWVSPEYIIWVYPGYIMWVSPEYIMWVSRVYYVSFPWVYYVSFPWVYYVSFPWVTNYVSFPWALCTSQPPVPGTTEFQ